jgi:hypothetical protein
MMRRIFEGIGVFLAPRGQPGDEVGDRAHRIGRGDFSSALPMRSRTQAK